MDRYDFMFVMIVLGVLLLPAGIGVMLMRWAIGSFAPVWLAGILMFIAGAGAMVAAYWVAMKLCEKGKLK